MRRITVAAVAAAAAGLTLLAGPVLASGTTGAGSAFQRPTATCLDGTPRTGSGPNGWTGGRTDAMNGMNGNRGRVAGGMRGNGGPAAGTPAPNLPTTGALSTAQRQTLAAMAEEEKLAHDVYAALATRSSDVRFGRIATSEQRHLDAVRVLLDRYGLTDPTAGRAAGSFSSPAVQSLYGSLVAKGRVSDAAALEVGRTIEQTDIADLQRASTGLDAADVSTVYQRLLSASRHHLTAFGG